MDFRTSCPHVPQLPSFSGNVISFVNTVIDNPSKSSAENNGHNTIQAFSSGKKQTLSMLFEASWVYGCERPQVSPSVWKNGRIVTKSDTSHSKVIDSA
ncbi:hypothetical protein PoB_007053400 [Plakobranchus ocellatus]|uniref:Uncharacterized protein n=1 Tax=Plakobranchus ocellatus TaxID=259542 RepID=A0AAV4DII8_9GAST|nr:hypothetical protein PoB_007053400 [Plakobranchus ocellatus]